MTGDGTVISVALNEAVVRISKSSACGHNCASCNACSNPSYEMTVSNPLGAKVGDRVVIESDSSKILALSFLIYILPVFLLIIAAVICQEYSLGVLSLIVFGVMISFWILLIRLVNKKISIKNTIVKIIPATPAKD